MDPTRFELVIVWRRFGDGSETHDCCHTKIKYTYIMGAKKWRQVNLGVDKLISINKIPTVWVNDTISKPRIIVGIDPGIVHLGLAWVEFCDLKIVCKGASCVNLKEACDPSLHKHVRCISLVRSVYNCVCAFKDSWVKSLALVAAKEVVGQTPGRRRLSNPRFSQQ